MQMLIGWPSILNEQGAGIDCVSARIHGHNSRGRVYVFMSVDFSIESLFYSQPFHRCYEVFESASIKR